MFRLFIVTFLAVSAFAERPTRTHHGPQGRGEQKEFTDGVLVVVDQISDLAGFHVLDQGRGHLARIAEVSTQGSLPENFIARLSENEVYAIKTGRKRRVVHAEPSLVARIRGAPNDERWSLLWYYGAPQRPPTPSIGFPDVEMLKNLDYSHGEVHVGDTGCPDHVDFDSSPAHLVDRQKFVVGDPYPGDPTDRNGHGTGVIGLMGARTNNTVGIPSMGFGLKFGCSQIVDQKGNGTLLGIINFLDHVTERQRSRVQQDPKAWSLINLSVGGYGRSELLEAAKARAKAAKVKIFASPGNYGVRLGSDIADWFASDPYVFATGATNDKDQMAVFSDGYATDFGPSLIGFAPGSGIQILNVNNTYMSDRGTSYSNPIAAVVAALKLTQNPDMSDDALRISLMNGDPMEGTYVGLNYVRATDMSKSGRRLNVANTLAQDPVPPEQPTVTISRIGHASLNLEISSNDNVGIFGCVGLLSEQPFTTGNEPFVQWHGKFEPNFVDGFAKVSMPVQAGSAYSLAAVCYDKAGNLSPISDIVRIETPNQVILSVVDGGSDSLVVSDGPTAPLFPKYFGQPSGTLFRASDTSTMGRIMGVGADRFGLSGMYGDNFLNIPFDLSLVTGETLSVTFEADVELYSAFNALFKDPTKVQRAEGLVELWMFAPDSPDGIKLSDIRNTDDVEYLRFDVTEMLRHPGAELRVRVYLNGTNTGRIRLGRVLFSTDERN